MQISINSDKYQPKAFTARNPDIRAIDDIARIVKRELPMFSNTKMDSDPIFKTNLSARPLYRYVNYIETLISEMRGFSHLSKSKSEEIIKAMETSKRLKVGNCHEMSTAAYIGYRLNGHKNVKMLRLYAYDVAKKRYRPLDHTIVGFNFSKKAPEVTKESIREFFVPDKKSIVSDLWAGMTDFGINAANRYRLDHRFGYNLKSSEELRFAPIYGVDELSYKDFIYFKKKYPNLLNKKKKRLGLIDTIIWKFMNKDKYEFEQFPQTVVESAKKNCKLKGAMSDAEINRLYQAKAAKHNDLEV